MLRPYAWADWAHVFQTNIAFPLVSEKNTRTSTGMWLRRKRDMSDMSFLGHNRVAAVGSPTTPRRHSELQFGSLANFRSRKTILKSV